MTDKELQTLKNRYDLVGNDPAFNDALKTALAMTAATEPVT